MFVVRIDNAGGSYWLRGTTWAFSIDRADRFESEDTARAAFAKAAKFTKPAMRKLAKIVPA
jgi:hypothetical protein